jgi:methionine-R-sulfoxide reductase
VLYFVNSTRNLKNMHVKPLIFLLLLNLAIGSTFGQAKQFNNQTKTKTPMQKTEEEWKKALSPEQYYILRQKGTERPYSGKFYAHKERGMYTCAGCGVELFSSDQKFDAHCGWPSFFDELPGGKVKTHRDVSHGMVRTEITCANCGGHLGHVFDDGPKPTGLRYCVNSGSLEFKEVKK